MSIGAVFTGGGGGVFTTGDGFGVIGMGFGVEGFDIIKSEVEISLSAISKKSNIVGG